MYWRYRRNADEDIRDLERRFYEGDYELLPRLVNYYVRADSLSIGFLLRYPESFEYLPADYQQQLQQMTGAIQAPPPAPPPAPQIPHGVEYEEEDYDEDEDEDDEHAAERDAGEYWDCANCGRDLFESDRGEEWELLSEDAAAITSARIGRGEAGMGMCLNCLDQTGLDLDMATEEDLSEDYCLDCGEEIDDCGC